MSICDYDFIQGCMHYMLCLFGIFSDKAELEKCMDLVGEMYKLNFDTKDYCAKPTYKKAIIEDNLII